MGWLERIAERGGIRGSSRPIRCSMRNAASGRAARSDSQKRSQAGQPWPVTPPGISICTARS